LGFFYYKNETKIKKRTDQQSVFSRKP
jgi:hypothetical protein